MHIIGFSTFSISINMQCLYSGCKSNARLPNSIEKAKYKEWPNISIIVPGNITIKGVSLPKLQRQSNKRIYGNKDIQWYYRKSPFYIPFYYPVLNLTSISDRYISQPIQTKINRNVRPKGTHSHFKFYH